MKAWGVWLKARRPLPMTIAVIMALLPLKIYAMVQAAGGAPAALGSAGRAMVPAAQAASAPERSAPEHATSAAPATIRPAAPAPAAAIPPAEPAIPDSERAVLVELRARRGVIDAREQALGAREAILAAAEKRLMERVEQLTTLQARLEQLDAGRRERDEANWRGLVKTYETMRPRDAAAILNDMETPVLLQVLDRMKETKTALVLAAMLPDRARNATAQLAQMRSRSVAPPTLAASPPSGPQG